MIDGADGPVSLTNAGLAIGVNGPSITGAGINAGNQPITNVADGTDNDHAVNVSQLNAVDETAKKGWQLAAVGTGGAEQIKPGDTATFAAGTNLEVERDGAKITYKTADEVVFDKVTITSGPTISSSGINMAGKKITGLGEGVLDVNSDDVVTGGQIYDFFLKSDEGVRYFHAKSVATDSKAEGEESIAIGPNTVAGGDGSFAAGDGAITTDDATESIALGKGARAGTDGRDDGEAAIAIGRATQALGKSTIAMGDGASVDSFLTTNSLAIGSGAIVSGEVDGASAIGHGASANAAGATAVGQSASASGGNAAAFGRGADASGGSSIALGSALASGSNAIAAGTSSQALTSDSIALGTNAGIGVLGDPGGNRHSHIAIGLNAGQRVDGNQTIAIGSGAGSDVGAGGVSSTGSIAIGTDAGRGIGGEYNIAIGAEANKDKGSITHTTAIGYQATSDDDAVAVGARSRSGDTAVAVGADAKADDGGVALGQGAVAQAGHVALGFQSQAVATDALGQGYLTGSAFIDGTVVSVGNTSNDTHRRIVNVADGANNYDAVNVRQLRRSETNVANLIGGAITVNPTGGFDGYIIELTDTDNNPHQYKTVAEAIQAVVSADGINVALPANAVTFNTDGTLTLQEPAGELDQAVNLGQMNAAINEGSMKYYSVDPNSDLPNKDNTGATGANAMAAGPGASAIGESSLAMGHNAQVQGSDEAVAIGYGSRAQANKATVLGNSSRVHDVAGVAIGSNTVSHGVNSIAMGTGALTEAKDGAVTVDDAIAIGTNARSTADDATAIGHDSRAAGVRSVAQGFDAHALAESAIAHGTSSRATALNAQASGTNANASATNAQARGTGAQASAQSAQASGTGASASGVNSVATGTRAISYADNGIALGTDTVSGFEVLPGDDPERNRNSIAIGNKAHATDLDAMAVGRGAQADAEKAAAFGDGAEARAEQALAAGAGAEASGDNSTALGAGARALHNRSVALGDGAQTADAVGTVGFTTAGGVDYAYAGTTPIATVSVGKTGEERTITHVAAGRVSALSTDAINGSQLYQTHNAMGSSVAAALGGGSSYDSDTFTVTADLNVRDDQSNFDNVEDALKYVGQGWDVSAQGGVVDNVAPGGKVDFSNTDDNIEIARFGTDLTFDLNKDITLGGVGKGSGSLIVKDDIDPDKMTSVEAGVVTVVGGGGANSININGNTGTIGGLTNTTFDPDNFVSGQGATEDQLKSVSDTANAGWYVGVDGEVTGEKVAPGAKVDFSNTDGNIEIARSGTDLTFNLDKDIDLTEDGSLTIGDARVDNDGLTVDDGAGNSSTTTVQGTTVVDDAGNITTTTAKGMTVTDGAATTTVGAGLVSVGGDINTVVINGDTGTIGGLTNTTFDPDNFVSG